MTEAFGHGSVDPRVVVDTRGFAAAVDPAVEAVRAQREALPHRRMRRPPVVTRRQYDALGAVERRQRDVLDVQAPCEFGDRDRIHLGGVDTPRHQRRHAAQRGLLARPGVGLPAAFLGLRRPQPGLAGQDAGQERQRKEHEDRGQGAVAVRDVEEDVDGGAHERRRHREAEVPARRDHQHAEQEQRAVGVVRCGAPHEHHEGDLADDEADSDHDAPAQRPRGRAQNQREHPSAQPYQPIVHRTQMLVRAPARFPASGNVTAAALCDTRSMWYP